MKQHSIIDVIDSSGLDNDQAETFLREEFESRGLNFETSDIDDLREVLADLLQDLILEMTEPSHGEGSQIN